jgi:hypothetical protein
MSPEYNCAEPEYNHSGPDYNHAEPEYNSAGGLKGLKVTLLTSAFFYSCQRGPSRGEYPHRDE